MLKRKLSKAEFESVSENLKEFYIASSNGESYLLDTESDDDVGALKRAKEYESSRRKSLQIEADELRAKLTSLEEQVELKEFEGKKVDLQEVEKRFEERYSKTTKEIQDKLLAKTKYIENKMLSDASEKLASDLLSANPSVKPRVLIPHIRPQLGIEYDGDEPQVVVLDGSGKAFSRNLDDLKKKFVEDQDFAGMIQVSQATGSGSNDRISNNRAVPKNGSVKDMTEAEIVQFAIDDPEGFARATNN